jgi:hypothetical protein
MFVFTSPFTKTKFTYFQDHAYTFHRTDIQNDVKSHFCVVKQNEEIGSKLYFQSEIMMNRDKNVYKLDISDMYEIK